MNSYGYKAAQLHVSDRMTTATAEDTDGDTDSSGNAYAEDTDYSYKPGAERGASYADAEHTDAEDLVAAGVIESTDEVDAYAATKHAEISSRFEGTDGMTAQERHEHFSQFSHDGFAGDTAEELQSDGIIG